MKTIITILVLLISVTIYAEILEVSLDGTKPYTSIQSAVDVAVNGDIVQVYPGTYRESVLIRDKSITLQSLYAVTPDTTYIHNTRIIAECPDPALYVGPEPYSTFPFHYHTVSINGLTFMNNENQLNNIPIYYNIYGAIHIYRTNANVLNNIMTDSYGRYGGGLSVSSTQEDINLYLENNHIYNNRVVCAGGGLSIGANVSVTFSQENRNSIYNNYANGGNDLAFIGITEDVVVYLDKCSRIIDEPEGRYMYVAISEHLSPFPEVTVGGIQRESLPPLIDHDLYVAPWGDDNNSGLSPDSPLKTIAWATNLIDSNSNNPKTIHLAEGTYSRSLNQQILPFFLPKNTNLIGAGMLETIFDGEDNEGLFSFGYGYGIIEFGNFSAINFGNHITNSGNTIIMGQANNIKIYNILMQNNKLYANGIHFYDTFQSDDSSVYVKNIIVKDSYTDPGVFYQFNNVHIENYIIDKFNSDDIGFWLTKNDNVLLNNFSFTNSSSDEFTLVFQLHSYIEDIPDEPGLAILNNVLIANNDTSDPLWWNVPAVNIYNYNNETILNNWTIANNRGPYRTLGVGGNLDITINNFILYNPEIDYELFISGYYPNAPVTVNNSLIYGGYDRIQIPDNQNNYSLNNLIFDAPLFAGEFDDNLTMDMLDYYQLHSSSPCIDAGVIDTTGMHFNGKDLAGNQRVWNYVIDMGCFEYGAPHVGVNDETVPEIKDYNLINFPNPVNLQRMASTIISFDYPGKTNSEPVIEIFNIKGQKVRTLHTGPSFYDLAVKAGLRDDTLGYITTKNYTVSWDCKNENNQIVSTGVYFYRAKIGGKVIQTSKMLILK
jgi:hypothetical protein